MEKSLNLTNNGQQMETADFNLLGQESGKAADRVYAELFRMAPYDGTTVAKGILPSALPTAGGLARTGTARFGNGTVQSNGPTGKVCVKPCRILIGSRTAVGTDARANWRDIQSGLSVVEGATTLDTLLTIAPNSSGGHRIDAVIAVVTVDADSPPVTRKVKNPISGVVTSPSVSVYQTTDVSLQIVTGTGDVLPSIPTDASGTYYVLLAYLDILDGFNGTSQLEDANIKFVGNVLHLSRAAGGISVKPADCHNNGGYFATMPPAASGFLPTTMQGGDSVFFHTGYAASGGVLDHNDWRNRICKFTACLDTGNNAAWDGVRSADMSPSGPVHTATDTAKSIQVGMGQTFLEDPGSGYTGLGNHRGAVAYIDLSTFHPTYTGTVIVYCDYADGGKLKLYTTGSVPNFLFWIDFSAPFENYTFYDT